MLKKDDALPPENGSVYQSLSLDLFNLPEPPQKNSTVCWEYPAVADWDAANLEILGGVGLPMYSYAPLGPRCPRNGDFQVP